MISLTITIDGITSVLQIFDTVQIKKWAGSGIPSAPVSDADAATYYVTVSGVDTLNGISDTSEIHLSSQYSQYYFTDPNGSSTDWYISRYYSYATGSISGWSDPIQGEPGDLYYNPQFPPEISYGSSDQLIIDRIRLLIGDPIGLRREYGDEALSSIHLDKKTYEMDETGWPAFINMGGVPYTSTDNPSVNGYRFLRFKDYIDETCTTCTTYSGSCDGTPYDVLKEVTHGVDIWYYTFRHSDRQIMEAYDSCFPPAPLTETTATSEAYMIQTAIDLLRKELWEDATEDGASIKDEGSHYDPSPGLNVRKKLIDDLEKRLKVVVRSTMLSGITGVLLD